VRTAFPAGSRGEPLSWEAMKQEPANLTASDRSSWCWAPVFLTFTHEKEIRKPLESAYGIDDPQFQRSMSTLLGPPLSRQPRGHAPQRRPDLPGDARGDPLAKRTITFETYIYWSGDVGKAFADALAERARRA
jgi:hypothetical protein